MKVTDTSAVITFVQAMCAITLDAACVVLPPDLSERPRELRNKACDQFRRHVSEDMEPADSLPPPAQAVWVSRFVTPTGASQPPPFWQIYAQGGPITEGFGEFKSQAAADVFVKLLNGYVRAYNALVDIDLVSLNRRTPSLELNAVELVVFEWLRRQYVQRSDDRQAALGLTYTTAETHDLARELVRYFNGSPRLGVGFQHPIEIGTIYTLTTVSGPVDVRVCNIVLDMQKGPLVTYIPVNLAWPSGEITVMELSFRAVVAGVK